MMSKTFTTKFHSSVVQKVNWLLFQYYSFSVIHTIVLWEKVLLPESILLIYPTCATQPPTETNPTPDANLPTKEQTKERIAYSHVHVIRSHKWEEKSIRVLFRSFLPVVVANTFLQRKAQDLPQNMLLSTIMSLQCIQSTPQNVDCVG